MGRCHGEMQRSTTREESKYGNGVLANTQTAAIDRLVRLLGINPCQCELLMSSLSFILSRRLNRKQLTGGNPSKFSSVLSIFDSASTIFPFECPISTPTLIRGITVILNHPPSRMRNISPLKSSSRFSLRAFRRDSLLRTSTCVFRLLEKSDVHQLTLH